MPCIAVVQMDMYIHYKPACQYLHYLHPCLSMPGCAMLPAVYCPVPDTKDHQHV